MKIFGNQKTEQKVQQNAHFFELSKNFLLYEAEKKISFLEKDLKANDKAAEKALNNKEALKARAPMHSLTFSRDNSQVLAGKRVIIEHAQQKHENVDRQQNNTKNIFLFV